MSTKKSRVEKTVPVAHLVIYKVSEGYSQTNVFTLKFNYILNIAH